MLPGLGSSSPSCEESSQTSGFSKFLSSLHHLWVKPQKPQVVWDPRNNTPVPMYLQQYGCTQCSQPGYSQFADSDICVCGLGCFGDLSSDHAPLCISHLFKVIPTPHIQHPCGWSSALWGYLCMADHSCVGTYMRFQLNISKCWSSIRWLNWSVNWSIRSYLSPMIPTGLKGEQV